MKTSVLLLIVLAVLIITNTVSFCLMAADKKKAAAGKWRISEKALFISCACFGGLGGVLGMQLLRHKTQHWYFKVFFPLFLILQIALLAAGAWLLLR